MAAGHVSENALLLGVVASVWTGLNGSVTAIMEFSKHDGCGNANATKQEYD